VILLTVSIMAGILELIILAARVFSREVHDQTWESLRMLPQSAGWTAWSKIRGCLRALGPVGVLFALGLLCQLDEVLKELWHDVSMEGRSLVFFWIYLICAAAFALTLVCYTSLKTNPWLGIVISLAVFYFADFAGYVVCMEALSPRGREGRFVVFGGKALIDAVLARWLVGRITRVLTGERAAG
jgi:hypothetical protein